MIEDFTTGNPANGLDPGWLLKKNYLYRRILGMIRKLRCYYECPYTISVQNSFVNSITGQLAMIRKPEPLALATTILNAGTRDIEIYEGNARVRIAKAGESTQLPVRGRLVIRGRCLFGSGASIVVVTYKRCLCGEPEPEPYPDEVPYGSNRI